MIDAATIDDDLNLWSEVEAAHERKAEYARAMALMHFAHEHVVATGDELREKERVLGDALDDAIATRAQHARACDVAEQCARLVAMRRSAL